MDQINNTYYLSIETYTEFESLITSQYSFPDAFNIYIINGTIIGAAARGTVFKDFWFLRKWTLTHEFGHNFGLAHTFNGDNLTCPNQEHSARFEADGITPSLNAIQRGDRVLDTHATGNMSSINFDNNCNYIGGAIDCEGTPIVSTMVNGFLVNPAINNYLYPEDISLTCEPFFSPGQGKAMRENIIGYWANSYNAQMNSIESLYQPFYQNVFPGEIVSSDDDPDNGGVNVCRKIKVQLRFQPGFYTEFSDTEYGTIIQTEYQQFNYDDKLDHSIGVRIPILDDSQIIKTAPVSSLLPFFCSFEPYTSGTLLSTEILGSMNITIKELDEIQVKDPKLYDSLMEKYYYILKQRTESGVEKEKVFYKP